MTLLKDDFIECVTRINPDPICSSSIIDQIANIIFILYSESFRAYHNLNHIEYGLNLLKQLKYLCKNYDLIRYAWWYHDIIYLPNSINNEYMSIDRAVFDGLQLNCLTDNTTVKVSKMIMATKHINAKVESDDEKLIHDIDLAILGVPNFEEYKRYYDAIRKEFKLYPLEKYKKGRLFILRNFLKLERIYYTDYFYNHFEEQARKNIESEILHEKLE